ncbi:unnamed protein product [Orchesella dallaii]|uniref:UDP-N-acetylglucosamine 4-epimerase n=1 Tax=Orchesella dallaii TaxID=48710 RepID=A0ABP1RHP5_9HEXA
MRGKTVLVTGGAGYIGSHCCVDLIEAGYDVVAVDNFANSVENDGVAPSLKQVERITGKSVTFQKCDLLDRDSVIKLFKQHQIDCVIHTAALKVIGDSMLLSLQYYNNNLIGTINLLEAMEMANCYDFVYSSSCTVYGDPEFVPITEDHPTGNVKNVYGRTKYFIEEMLKDLSNSDPKWNIISLRYFNPVSAHPSGLLGEDPTKENHYVLPYIVSVALGKKPHVTIFGRDYKTPDGTGVRDYIHIMDLASGHVAALKKLGGNEKLGFQAYNLGLGRGLSVLELIKEFEKVTGTHVPIVYAERRVGDAGAVICSTKKALSELNWAPKYGLPEMCQDLWRWQTMFPNGYKTEKISHEYLVVGGWNLVYFLNNKDWSQSQVTGNVSVIPSSSSSPSSVNEMASSSSSATNQASGGGAAGGGDGDGNPNKQPQKTDEQSKQVVMPFPTHMLPEVCKFMPVEELWKLADVSSEWRTIVLPFIMERTMNVDDGAAGGGP